MISYWSSESPSSNMIYILVKDGQVKTKTDTGPRRTHSDEDRDHICESVSQGISKVGRKPLKARKRQGRISLQFSEVA